MAVSLAEMLATENPNNMREIISRLTRENRANGVVPKAAQRLEKPRRSLNDQLESAFKVERNYEKANGKRADYLTMEKVTLSDGSTFALPWLRVPAVKGALSHALLTAAAEAEKHGL